MEQPATRSLVLQPADLIIYYDKRFPADPEAGINELPLNRVGVVVDESGALFISRGFFSRQVERVPLQSIRTLPNLQIRRVIETYAVEVAEFFRCHADRPTHFEAGLRALHAGNLQPLIARAFFPNRPVYKTADEYESAWHQLKANLKPADTVFTIDLQSRLSRFIAWATDGAWSHEALHMGQGEIWESVTSGVRNGPIELYKGQRHWVAVYRHVHALTKSPTKEEIEAAVRGHPFRSNAYNYRAALRFGWKAFCGDHTHALVPNSAVLQGNLVLIAHA